MGGTALGCAAGGRAKATKEVKNDRWIRRCKGKQLLQNPSFAKHLWDSTRAPHFIAEISMGIADDRCR